MSSDSVSYYPQTTRYPVATAEGQPIPANGPAGETESQSPATEQENQYEGRRRVNKYVGSSYTSQDSSSASGSDDAETADIMQNAGIPGVNGQTVKLAEARIQSDPALRAGTQRMTDDINAMADPSKVPAATTDMLSTAEQLAKSKNIDVWQLLVVALKGAVRDQNDQLRDDLQQLQILSKISSVMSSYSDVLQQTQQALDDKMNAEKDDKKKSNMEVALNDQRRYDPSDLNHLNANGDVNYTQEASSDPNQNMVSAQGLQTKIQMFTQERDQLQKNIDKGTQKYQSDYQNKDQIISTITAILKNYYDMLSGNGRNLDL